jgi:hypothetical protein
MPLNLEQRGAVEPEPKEYRPDLSPSERQRHLMLQCLLTEFFEKLQESKQEDPKDGN